MTRTMIDQEITLLIQENESRYKQVLELGNRVKTLESENSKLKTLVKKILDHGMPLPPETAGWLAIADSEWVREARKVRRRPERRKFRRHQKRFL